jgi:hypothetical protein
VRDFKALLGQHVTVKLSQSPLVSLAPRFFDGMVERVAATGRQGCVRAAHVQDINPDAADPAARVSLRTLDLQDRQLVDPHDGTLLPLPPLWGIFAGADAGAGLARG